MIILNVQKIARERGIETASQLFAVCKLPSINTAYAVWEGNAVGLQFKTLDRLCKGLASAPGELILFVEKKKKSTKPAAKSAKKKAVK